MSKVYADTAIDRFDSFLDVPWWRTGIHGHHFYNGFVEMGAGIGGDCYYADLSADCRCGPHMEGRDQYHAPIVTSELSCRARR